jgi:hypothetical protein
VQGRWPAVSREQCDRTLQFALVALVLGALLAPRAPLEFTPRFPTAPNPGSWANPYEATDPVTGLRYELKPRLPDLGRASAAPGEPFAPGSVENP